MTRQRFGLLFDFDWDEQAFARQRHRFDFDRAGFDLFSFPSNLHLATFDLRRFAARQARRGRARGWRGVVSHHEQFGALAAALVAEQLGLPGTAPEAVLAIQHKLHARRVLQRVCPDANLDFAELPVDYSGDIPAGLRYPCFAKPVKAAFSVLARRVNDAAELHAHTRFGRREAWVIRRLVEPFERVLRERLPQAGSAHRMLLEEPVSGAAQYNLDGYVFRGEVRKIGVVDAVMYPGTHCFMRFDVPTRLNAATQQRALQVARRFLEAVGFGHGFFNMEFFHDPASGRISVIEFNPRLASQCADLYRRVEGIDAHAMSLALALGEDPASTPRRVPEAGAASSFVYRAFTPAEVCAQPDARRKREFAQQFPQALLLQYPKRGASLQRDFKWLDSHRYAIIHLGAADDAALREHCVRASALLGWPAPYADLCGRGDNVAQWIGRPSAVNGALQ
jgi:hypothetical protein